MLYIILISIKKLLTSFFFGTDTKVYLIVLYISFRGYIYIKNLNLNVGWISWGSDVLLYRPQHYDNNTECTDMIQRLDKYTLKVGGLDDLTLLRKRNVN